MSILPDEECAIKRSNMAKQLDLFKSGFVIRKSVLKYGRTIEYRPATLPENIYLHLLGGMRVPPPHDSTGLGF